MRVTKDNLLLLIGRHYPLTADHLDIRVYCNNWLGFSFVVFGWGIRLSVRLKKVSWS